MSLLTASHVVRLSRLFARRVAATLALAVLAPAPAGAQTTLSHTEDAAPLPAGMLRLRVTSGWTRFDQRFSGAGGLTPLGAELATDSLGSTQLPRLAPVELALRTLANDARLRLSLGRLAIKSDARIVTLPVALEYGLTSRLSVGVLVPIVQSRRTVQPVIKGDTTLANVGFVPLARRTEAAAVNAAVAAAYQSAADNLGALIARCQQNPAAAGCAPYNANPAGATAARTQALSFAEAARAFGITATSALVAPRDKGALARAIDAQRVALNQRLQQYLGAGAGSPTPVFGAATDFSYIDLQGRNGIPGLLQSPLGGGLDSLHTTERVYLGDVAVGAQFMVFDRFQRDSLPPRGIQARLAVGGAVRFATSLPDSARNLVDMATGDGAGVQLHGALDLIGGRFGGTIAGRYVRSFARTVEASLLGDPEAPWPYPLFGSRQRRAGDVAALDLTPRYFLSDWLALDAHYGLERIGPATWDTPLDAAVIDPCAACLLPGAPPPGAARTAQRVGLGIRYSTVDAYARSAATFPVEVSFTHLETMTGSPGMPKDTRDQIQVRLFYRLLSRR
jgi:hypothetical protein